MNNQKPQKPTLSGQRFKTRKRGKRSVHAAVGARSPMKSPFLTTHRCFYKAPLVSLLNEPTLDNPVLVLTLGAGMFSALVKNIWQ